MRPWLALIGCLLAILGCTTTAAPNRAATPASTQAVQSRPAAAVDAPSGLPVVRMQDLPPEAMTTLRLIERGGPFPHRQDGATFENREGHLPSRRSGYYKEYTVDTPGADDRGARRIVAGASGERYWTDDHYDSFAWIAP
jgi:ribonuclease T1